MKTNMGRNDKLIRTGLAAVIAILYFSNVITGTWATVLLVVAAVFVLTSLVGFCPLYTLLGVNTCGRKQP
jgi:putative copper export protein